MPHITPPNILWICSDQQRFDTLGCYANPFVRTPNLDRLATEGALFTHAFCQSPVCTPSRASFLTGRYPRTTRARQNGQDIPADEVLVTRLLADAGYVCGLAGKLHISACEPRACPTSERRIADGYSDFHWSHHPYGHDWPVQANEYQLWLQQHGTSYDQLARPCPLSPHIHCGPPEEFHQTTSCADRAINFLQHRAASPEPWLFSLNFFDPHHPFDAPEAALQRYLPILDRIPLPNFTPGEHDDKPPYQACDHHGAYGGRGGYPFPRMSATDHRLVRASYYAMCDLLDHQVGRILAALNATDQADNTLVIYMSDHGELLGDHGLYLKGPFFYEPSIRVPLILRWPHHIAPGLRDALVELTDLAPTLLEAAGLPPRPGMQGRSLVPLSPDPGAPQREEVYCEYYNALRSHRDPAAHCTMLRTATYKLVVDHSHPDSGELYDLVVDPAETHNLFHRPAHAPIRADLLLRLTHRLAFTADPLPVRRSGW